MARVVHASSDALVIDLGGELPTLSTAACPGNGRVRYVVFSRVPRDFSFVDLDEYCRGVASSLGLGSEPVEVFLTAVDVSGYSRGSAVVDGVAAEAFVTYGVEEPACVGARPAPRVGTINVAVIVDRPLSSVGLLDLFRLVSEVKGGVMALAGPQCGDGLAIGTASDATSVSAPPGGERFAGPATAVGQAAALALLEALARHLAAYSPREYLAATLGRAGAQLGDDPATLLFARVVKLGLTLVRLGLAPIRDADSAIGELVRRLGDEFAGLFRA